MKIGDVIKRERKNNKLTQKQLAHMINKSERMVQKYENGEVIPSLDVLEQLSSGLKINRNVLIQALEFNLFASSGSLVSNSDLDHWDETITPKLYLERISTQDLIEELNSRDDFPIKINIKKDLP